MQNTIGKVDKVQEMDLTEVGVQMSPDAVVDAFATPSETEACPRFWCLFGPLR